MKKTISRLFSVLIVLCMCCVMSVPVFAEENEYTPVDGDAGAVTFDKYLVMDESAMVPNIEFEYTISHNASLAKSYDVQGKQFEVLEGIGEPTITWDSYADRGEHVVKFTTEDATILYAERGLNDFVKNLTEGQKYAKHTATIDFSSVSFPEPGVYRYVITENTESTYVGIRYDENSVRYLDVYVVNASDSEEDFTLKIESYVLHATDSFIPSGDGYGTDGVGEGTTSTEADGTAESDYKSQGFTNVYITHTLQFSKKVSGNQASRDKYFQFTLSISGALPNTQYVISFDADANDHTIDGFNANTTVGNNTATLVAYRGLTNPTVVTGSGSDVNGSYVITTNESGQAEVNFYLQHNQGIAVRGIADGTVFQLTEDAEDYKPSVSVSGSTTATSSVNDTVTDTGINDDTTVEFTNTRSGNVPTGVLLSIAPAVGLIAVAGIGSIIIFGKKKKTEE